MDIPDSARLLADQAAQKAVRIRDSDTLVAGAIQDLANAIRRLDQEMATLINLIEQQQQKKPSRKKK